MTDASTLHAPPDGDADLAPLPDVDTDLDWPDLGRLHAMLRGGQLTSVELTARCLARIDAVDPRVRAVLAVAPDALDQAAQSDRRYAASRPLGPLDGIPVLVKDNIDTAGLASTAGSRLLATVPPRRDALIVSRLRGAGAVILGKTNLSEWGNFRSTGATEGWSAVGGQTRNPYRFDHSPWGSSAGSAVAVSTGMAPLAIGTETDGSVVCPAAVNGVVGVKPELGLLPLRGVVPISDVQDVVGVLATRVSDAMLCLTALTGGQPVPAGPEPLIGRRFGRWRVRRMPEEVEQVLDAAEERLWAAGAQVVPVRPAIEAQMLVDGLNALLAEFQPSVEAYLRGRDDTPGTLAGLIAANRADPVELSLFGQDLFEQTAALGPADREVAPTLRERSRRQARDLIDGLLAEHQLDALLAATSAPAWPIDHDRGDPHARNSSTLAALAGYPNTSVPVGFVGDLPVGLSLFGPASTTTALRLAYAVEQACGRRRPPTRPDGRVIG